MVHKKDAKENKNVYWEIPEVNFTYIIKPIYLYESHPVLASLKIYNTMG